MLDDRPVVASLEDDPEGCEEQPDILGSLYDETQQWIMENYPDSYAAQTYIAAAEELVNGTDAQSGENGYYTYIYNPPAGYAWQVVALVGEEIAGGTGSRMCRVFRNRNTIPLHGQLLLRLPAAALI